MKNVSPPAFAATIGRTYGLKHALVYTLEHPAFLPVCFLVFIAVRVAILFVPAAVPFSDAGWYLARAVTLATEGTYSEDGVPTAYWPVGYPGFLGLLFTATGPSLLAARLANVVFAACSFWLLLLLTRRFFGDELVARTSVLLLTVYPNSIAYVSLLATETLYTFLLLAATLALLSPRRRSNVILAGILFGLATLVKTQTLALIPILAFIAHLGSWSSDRIKPAMLRAALVLCISLCVLAPWSWRNFVVFDEFVLVSTNGGKSLLAGNNPSVVGDYRKDYSATDPLMAQVRFTVADQVAADKRARALAYDWIKNHPTQFLGLIPKKLFRFWAPDGEGEWGYQDTTFYEQHWIWFRSMRVVNQIYYFAVLLLFTLALWRLVRLRPKPAAWLGVAVAGIFTAISVVFSGQSRYHFPVMPFVFAYAAWVLSSGFGRWVVASGRVRI